MFNPIEPATFQRWLQYVADNTEEDGPRQIKRAEPRVDVFGSAELQLASAPVRGSILEVSTHGLMVRSRTRIPLHSDVMIEAFLDDEAFSLTGTVVHCTQTVGAFKVGIQLNAGDSHAAA